MIQIDSRYRSLLLEALTEMRYKISLQLETYKGQPMSQQRKELTRKQQEVEQLQYLLSNFDQ